MPNEFVALAQYLRRPDIVEPVVSHVCNEVSGSDCGVHDTNCAPAPFLSDALRAAAALADALAMLRADLLRDLACDVLGRELQLEPCDIAAIVEKQLAQCRAEFPIAVRVHPDDLAAISECTLAVVADAALRRGDALIDVRKGTIDVTFGARLAQVLAALDEL